MEFEDITYFLTKLAQIVILCFCRLCKIYVHVLSLVYFFPFLIRRRLSFLKTFLVLIKTNILTTCEGYMACHKGTTRGINPASGTAYTRPCNETIGFEQWCHL